MWFATEEQFDKVGAGLIITHEDRDIELSLGKPICVQSYGRSNSEEG